METFTVDALLDDARRATGLSDFGPEDYLEGLQFLLRGLPEAGIRADRLELVRERFLRLLINRLWFAKDLSDHREILAEPIEAPVVIASLPRTGSTKLHRMLGASGDFQTLKFWQANMPARIPGLADGGRERRIEQTRAFERWMYETSPAILTGHPMFTDEPEEDQFVIEGTFRHPMFFGLYDSLTYLQWVSQADLAPTFRYFHTLIQYLQWQSSPAERAKPWLFKTPNHLGNEQHLAAVLKRPRFIVTHRDPARCIPSISTTAQALRRLYSDRDSLVSLGAGTTSLFAQAAAAHLRWRDAHPEVPVLDLAFDEISHDGIAAARKVYAFLGLELTPRAVSAMARWQDDNGRDKHGKSAYSASALETTETDIRKAFAPYIERFSALL